MSILFFIFFLFFFWHLESYVLSCGSQSGFDLAKMECVFGAELEQWSLVTKVLPSDFGSQSASERLTLASFALGSSVPGNKITKLRATLGARYQVSCNLE